MKKIISIILSVAMLLALLAACDVPEVSGTKADAATTQTVAANLQAAQPTPTDIRYSLERDNLIRRAYWVNGMEEKARNLPCPVERPLGYIVLIDSGVVFGRYIVDGKVSSLNSYLTPDSEYYEIATGNTATYRNDWLADVDGSYGENDSGIFFFDSTGEYHEWVGTYHYSSQPFPDGDYTLNVSCGAGLSVEVGE